MAIDPERLGDGIKRIIDLKMGAIEARLAALETVVMIRNATPTTDSAPVSRAMFSSERAYRRDDTVVTSDGQLWVARRYTQGARHPRDNPGSWTRAL